jgi:N-acetylmuramoyl-L-alanine amidase
LAKRTKDWNLIVNSKLFNIRNKKVRNIVEDLRTDRIAEESNRLALAVHSQLIGDLKIKDRGIKKGNKQVLRWGRMPSILIEVGFLSNPEEEKNLRSRSYRRRLARSIANGIVNYKKQFEKLNRR